MATINNVNNEALGLDVSGHDEFSNKDGFNWIQRSFNTIQSRQASDPNVLLMRTYSSAMLKFTDTSPGGNLSINPLPQPSLWTDPPPIKDPSRIAKNKGKSFEGMGCFYSEMFDDTQEIIYLRFGVPMFNSLTAFYGNFYTSEYARIVRTGKASSTLGGKLGKGFGTALGLPLGIIALPGNIIESVGNALKFLQERPTSKFYYMKPCMPLYYQYAQNIINHIQVNKGFTNPMMGSPDNKFGDGSKNSDYYDSLAVYDNDPLNASGLDALTNKYGLATEYGGIFNQRGGIDLYTLVGKSQVKANAWIKLINANKNGSDLRKMALLYYQEDLYSGNNDIAKAYRPTITSDGGNIMSGFDAAISRWYATPDVGLTNSDSDSADADVSTMSSNNDNSYVKTAWTYMKEELNDGTAFVAFRVNNSGAASESFSNSFKESAIQSKINSASGAAREARFSLADGNISGGPLGTVINNTRDFIANAASSLGSAIGLSGLAVLYGQAEADIPQMYDRSTTSFTTKNYTIDLFSPYGDNLSQILNIYIPLSLLLAGALTRYTGKHSYTSPFLCQVFNKGKAFSRLAMIKDLSITRGGSGNIKWTDNSEPTGIQVNISIADMDSGIHIPLSEDFGKGAVAGVVNVIANAIYDNTKSDIVKDTINTFITDGLFDEDNAFMDYMMTLGSTPLRNMIYPTEKLKNRLRVNELAGGNWNSAGRVAMEITNGLFGDMGRMIYYGNLRSN